MKLKDVDQEMGQDVGNGMVYTFTFFSEEIGGRK